ncbi:MAG: SPOR domain-containing protein, partial [Longimicrobiales bacterium]|nr:SPOR domain-containing protein [Longimicrobiales bacterium]
SSMVEIGPEPLPPEAGEVPERDEVPGADGASVGPEPDAPDPAAAPPAPLRFGVRVGVFRESENAGVRVGELREVGYDPLVVLRRNTRGDSLFYVYAGGYANRDDAETAAAALRAGGGEVLVVELDLGAMTEPGGG